MQMQKKEKENEAFMAKMCEDLEGLDEKREEDQKRTTITERMFIEVQLVLRKADHVRRGIVGPSKFSPKWEGPFVVRAAYAGGYYYLAQMDRKDLIGPLNDKCLKHYYV